MGEASRARKRFFEQHPACCFCSGDTVATERDHYPPIACFDRRERPRGLEFPSCSSCNRGSKMADQVVAVISRLGWFENSDGQVVSDLKRFVSGLQNNHPEIVEEWSLSDWRLSQKARSSRVDTVSRAEQLHWGLLRFSILTCSRTNYACIVLSRN